MNQSINRGMSTVSAIRTWFADKPCPKTGSGERAVHKWILRAAGICNMHTCSKELAFNLIREGVEGCGRRVSDREINEAIEKAYGSSHQGCSAPAWPKSDLSLIEAITFSRSSDWSVLSELEKLSQPIPETADEVITKLFPQDSLICPGINKESRTTYLLSRLKNLSRFSLLVPSPMSALTGKTQSGKISGRCLQNVGPRRFLVTEFDFKREDRSGNPTIWASLIDKWESAGMSVQDAASAIILRLAEKAPLALVTYSGNVSLHAWWYCVGEREDKDSRMRKFMEAAVRLGADPATWTPCQFVRMPWGTNPKTKKLQTVHYFNQGVIKK